MRNALDLARNEAAAKRSAAAHAEELANAVAGPTLDLFHGVQDLTAEAPLAPAPVASWQPRDIPLSAPFNRYDLVRLKPEFVTNEEIPDAPFLLVNSSPMPVSLKTGGVHEVVYCEPQRMGWRVYVCLPDGRLGYVDDYRKLDKV